MSSEDSEGLTRTVTDAYRSRANQEMNVFGLAYGLGLLILLIPLLPFLAVIWVTSWLFGGSTDVERAY